MKLPFGKFKNRDLEDVPLDYIEWLLTIELRDGLAAAVKAEHERRMFSQQGREPVNIKIIDEIVGAGLRSLSKKYHPDVGGTHETMIAINAAADWIKGQARMLS